MPTIELEAYAQEFLLWGTRLKKQTTRQIIEEFADQFRTLEIVETKKKHEGIWDALRLGYVGIPTASLILERGIAVAYPLADFPGESQSHPTLLRLTLLLEELPSPPDEFQMLVEEYDDLTQKLQEFCQYHFVSGWLAKVPFQIHATVLEEML
jgi:hypothetical protein